jgi:XTP/dITP diphosphohydrolase
MESPQIHIFKGECDGQIVTEPHGDSGFGFDPIFQPTGATRTFAEMEPDEKNRHSHRGRAISRFAEFLK